MYALIYSLLPFLTTFFYLFLIVSIVYHIEILTQNDPLMCKILLDLVVLI